MPAVTVFYTPHQDDEALGMAGAIRQAIEGGREAYLVLISNGSPSPALLRRYNSNFFCHLCRRQHQFHYSAEQLIEARLAEFRASAALLEVRGVEEMSLDEQRSGEDEFVRRVEDKILEYELAYPGASHRLFSGRKDFATNSTHLACTKAAEQAPERSSRSTRFAAVPRL